MLVSLLLGPLGPRVGPWPLAALGGFAFDVRPGKTAYDMCYACSAGGAHRSLDRVSFGPFIKSANKKKTRGVSSVEFTKKDGGTGENKKKTLCPCLPEGGVVTKHGLIFFIVKFLYG